jgi:hypothetical protein
MSGSTSGLSEELKDKKFKFYAADQEMILNYYEVVDLFEKLCFILGWDEVIQDNEQQFLQ